MSWVEVFAVFVVSHLVGDYLFQTEWQALNKHGGLGANPTNRRALLSHLTTYMIAFIPATVWLWRSLHAGALGVFVLIAIPHGIQDDARLLVAYGRAVKKADLRANRGLMALVDQSFHILALFLTALLAGT